MVLRGRAASHPGLECQVTLRDRVARLRVSQPDSERVAVVSTPGDLWFSIDVESGLSLDYFDEEVPDVEVEQRLKDYVEVAVAYVQGGGTVKMGRGGPRSLQIQHNGTTFYLSRSLGGTLRAIFGIRSRPRRE